jgi:hypothetical protein
MAARLPVAVLVAAAFMTMVLSYRGDELVWGDDANLPLTIGDIDRYFQVTDRGIDGPDVRGLPFIMPMGAFLWLWSHSGIPYSPSLFQFALFSTLLAASGLSMYWLIRSFFSGYGRAAACGGALFYMFNLYSLTTIWSALANLVFHYSFLPLVIGCVLHAFRSRSVVLAALAAVVWALTLTPAYTTPPIALTDFLLFGGIAVFFLLKTDRWRDRVRTLGLLATISLIWFALNLFWIIPVGSYAAGEYSRLFVDLSADELFRLNSAPFLDAIRLDGYWGLEGAYRGSPYFGWSGYYDGVLEVVGYILPFFAVAALISAIRAYRGKRIPNPPSGVLATDSPSYVFLFTGILATALFFITGPNTPFGDLKALVFAHFDLAGVFRSVYQRFGVYAAVGYAPLIAGGIHAVAARTATHAHRDRSQLVYAVTSLTSIALVAGVLGLPLWTGQAYDRFGVFPSDRINVPNEYERVAHFIDAKRGDFVVLTLPFASGPSAVLRWNGGDDGYRGLEPLSLLSSRPFISVSHGSSYMQPLVRQVARGGPRAWPALRLLDVRYVVVHMDADRGFLSDLPGWIGRNPRLVDSALARAPELRLVFAGSMLRVYEVMPWQPFRLFALSSFPRKSLYALKFDQVRPVAYRALGDGRYVVRDRKLKADSTLVLNHPFDSNWRANGRAPAAAPPGLTGFKNVTGNEIVVSHRLDRRLPRLLFAVPLTLLVVWALLALRFLRTRGTTGG